MAGSPKKVDARAAVTAPRSPKRQSIPTQILMSGKDADSPPRGAYRVLITGGTQGLGVALAKRFCDAGDQVVVTSRDGCAVSEVVRTLKAQYGSESVFGTTCDVSRVDSVNHLGQFAQEKMGGIDIWINHADANGNAYGNLTKCEPDVLNQMVMANSLGSLLCCREAIDRMTGEGRSENGGHIFLMEGAGTRNASGNTAGAAYGHTQAGIAQLTKTLANELQGSGVGVHTISLGDVLTELLSSGRYVFDTDAMKDNHHLQVFLGGAISRPADLAADEIVAQVRALSAQSVVEDATEKLANVVPGEALKDLVTARDDVVARKHLMFEETKLTAEPFFEAA